MFANRKITMWFLTMALLLAALFPTGVFAAAGDVNSIAIEGENTTFELGVGKTKQLKVWASVEGSTSKKDVTDYATWTYTSDNGATLKLDKGLVTPTKSGTAIIKAVYSGSSSIITVKVVDTYSKLNLDYKLNGKYSLNGNEQDLVIKALANTDSSSIDPKDVTTDADWSSSNAAVLTVDKGKINLVGEGKATITAKYLGLTASYEATVTSPYSALKLYKVASPDVLVGENQDIESIMADKEIQLRAKTVLSADKTESDVSDKATWSSSDTSVATVKDGKVTILTAGKTTIKASYLGNQTSVDIYVRAPYEAIMLTPSTDVMLFIGEKLQMKAEVRSSANQPEIVSDKAEWSSSNKMTATVDNAGIIEAKAVGTTNIKVSYKGVSKTIKLTVNPTITKLEAEKTELDLLKGASVSVPKVTATKLDGDKIDLSDTMVWTSDHDDIATIKDGKIVSKETSGTALSSTVTLTGKLPEIGSALTSSSAFRGTGSSVVTVKLTVKEKVLALVTEDERLSLVIGEDTVLPKVNAVFENGEESANLTDLEWTVTGSNAVLKTTADGKKIKGLTKGTATLKATYSNKTLSIPVTIEPKITKIVVDPQTIELNLKKSKSIKATGYYTNGKTVNLSSKMDWKSSNESVASISTTSVKAVAEGTATITGSYQGQSVSVKVNVVPKIKKLTVDEKRLVLTPGAAKTVVITAEYDTGKISAVTDSAIWTSSKPSVAKVSAGRIEAVAKGSASIKATFGGKTVTISVSVKVK